MSNDKKGLAIAIAVGALAGLVATVPMTMAMTRIHRRLPREQRYALPPRIITDRVTRRSSLIANALPSDGARRALTAHFAFGALTGAVYGLLTETSASTPRLKSGVLYGLGIWTISYLGWVPAANLMPPATRQPKERNAMMIAAHIFWGATLGVTSAALFGVVRKARDKPISARAP